MESLPDLSSHPRTVLPTHWSRSPSDLDAVPNEGSGLVPGGSGPNIGRPPGRPGATGGPPEDSQPPSSPHPRCANLRKV